MLTLYESMKMICAAQNKAAAIGRRGAQMLKRMLAVSFIVPLVFVATMAIFAEVRSVEAAGDRMDSNQVAPLIRVANTPKGKLVDPYKDTQAAIVAEGSKLFQSYSCSGCHGGGGGGGICPPLTNGVWIYGGDDDTLFRLVTLGSDELKKKGYTRIGLENVVAPMPSFGTIIKNSDDLWKILTFVRSKYDGDPNYKYGNPPAAAGQADQ
jgi:mono/diheme cytochrome c family protein